MATSFKVPCRFSYLNLWKPRGMEGNEPKFSVSCLIPKTDTKTIEMIRKAEAEALVEFKDKIGKVTGKTRKSVLRDGDGDDKEHPAEYAGHWYINASASADRQPGAVDKNRQPIVKQDEIGSGDYGYVSINLFGFNTSGNNGLGAGFQNIMKVKDGERLSGGRSAESDFEDVDLSVFGEADDNGSSEEDEW